MIISKELGQLFNDLGVEINIYPSFTCTDKSYISVMFVRNQKCFSAEWWKPTEVDIDSLMKLLLLDESLFLYQKLFTDEIISEMRKILFKE